MNDLSISFKINFKSALLMLALLMLALFCQLTHANNISEGKALMLFEANVYRMLGDTSHYIYKDQDRNLLPELESTIERGNQLLPHLNQRWPNINSEWQTLVNLIHIELMDAEEVDLVHFPRHYETQEKRLLDEVKQAEGQVTEFEVSNNERPLLMSLAHLEQIIGAYLFFNINMFGSLAITESGIENYNDMFKHEVAKLDPILAKKIQRKWHFVEKTVLNYNKKSAVFIVRRTADSLRDLINENLNAEQPLTE